MDTRRLPFRHRLVGRLTLFGVLPALLLVGAATAYKIRGDYAEAVRDTEVRLDAVARQLAAEVDTQNRLACELVQTLASMRSVSWPRGAGSSRVGEREEFMRLLAELVPANPWSIGTYIVYEPDADGLDAHYLASPIAGAQQEGSGRFAPYAYLDWRRGNELRFKPNLDMESSLYYGGIREAHRASGKVVPRVTEPYVYDGQALIETVAPIVVDGRFVGIAGADRSLGGIARIVRQVCDEAGVDAFLVSSGSDVRGFERPRAFIVATVDPVDAPEDRTEGLLRASAVEESVYARLFESLSKDAAAADAPGAAQWRDASRAANRVVEREDPGTGELCLWTLRRLRLPDGRSWDLVVRESHADALMAADAQFASQVAVAGVGVGLLAVLLLIPAAIAGRQVTRATVAAGAFARGDLCVEPLAAAGRDEAARLLQALDAMREGVSQIVRRVQDGATTIQATATQLGAMSREQAASAHAMNASTTQVAAATREIAATTEAFGGAMERIAGSAANAASLARTGRTGLDGMGGTIRRLEESAESVSRRLADIRAKTATIGTVVTTITKVADQTNLLSVNAAIEAEKAGEHGKGFLVVAREIRRLADQVAGATLEIERMVSEMQDAVEVGVGAMDRFAEDVRQGVHEVSSIGGQLSQIVEHVDAGSAEFAELHAGMRAQEDGSRQISDAMGQLAANAREALSAAEETARAAEQLAAATRELRAGAELFKLRG